MSEKIWHQSLPCHSLHWLHLLIVSPWFLSPEICSHTHHLTSHSKPFSSNGQIISGTLNPPLNHATTHFLSSYAQTKALMLLLIILSIPCWPTTCSSHLSFLPAILVITVLHFPFMSDAHDSVRSKMLFLMLLFITIITLLPFITQWVCSTHLLLPVCPSLCWEFAVWKVESPIKYISHSYSIKSVLTENISFFQQKVADQGHKKTGQ